MFANMQDTREPRIMQPIRALYFNNSEFVLCWRKPYVRWFVRFFFILMKFVWYYQTTQCLCVCVPSFSMDNAAVHACMQLMAGVSSAGDNRAKQKGIYVNFHRKRLIAFCMLFIHNDGHKSISWINGCLTCYCHCMNAHQFKPVKYTFTFAITIKK